MLRSWSVLICLSAVLAGCAFTESASRLQHHSEADFIVTDTVINPQVGPFMATIGGFGNSLFRSGSGFEPVIFRNRYTVTQDSPDRIYARPADISHWDTYSEGMLDGARVRVYRIENRQFQLVRQDVIAQGGFHASGWNPVLPDDHIIPRGHNSYRFRWEAWSRPDVTYYFAVRSIGADGSVSAVSNVVSAVKTERPSSQEALSNAIKPLKFDVHRTGDIHKPASVAAEIEADGTLQLQWKAPPDENIVGYAVYRSDTPPESHKGYYLQLEGSSSQPQQPLRAGDMVVAEKKFYDASRKKYHTHRVWGVPSETQLLMPGLVNFFPDESPTKTWTLESHAADSPVIDRGETYLRVALQAGERVSLGGHVYAGTGQTWYDVLDTKPYQFDVWLRQQGEGSATFKVLDHYERTPHAVTPTVIRGTRQWQRHTAAFIPPAIQPGSQPGRIVLELEGPGTFDIDNFRVYRAHIGFLDYSSQEYTALKTSGMQALRTHGLIKTGRRTYNLEQLTNPGGVTSAGFASKQNTLPQTLKMMQKAGVRPWLQIEPHLSEQEWAGLIEYLAASYQIGQDTPMSKPWAYKRVQQGQSAPWTESFDRIYIELGNETWNRLFRPWNFEPMVDAVTNEQYSAGQVYGLYQEYVIGQFKQSQVWQEAGLDEKIEFVLGGRSRFRFGIDAAKESPSSRHLTYAAYIGGLDTGDMALPDAASSFQKLLRYPAKVVRNAAKHAEEVAQLNAMTGRALQIGTYEAGPGYTRNGLNNAKVTQEQAEAQERVMKSQAAGVATLDLFLAQASQGYGLQNYFTFGAGSYWTSHAPWYRGGQAYPAWKALSLFNQLSGGQLVQVKPSDSMQPRSSGIVVYATRAKDRLSVIVIDRNAADIANEDRTSAGPVANNGNTEGSSRDSYTKRTRIRIKLPEHTANHARIYTFSGNADSHNLHEDAVRMECRELTGDQWKGGVLDFERLHHGNKKSSADTLIQFFIFDNSELQCGESLGNKPGQAREIA